VKFADPIDVPVANHLTGRKYRLISAAALVANAETFARIAAVCNEPEIYDWLFRDLGAWGGRPYSEQDARQFLEWARAGWATGAYFVFLVIDESRFVAAACDIKTNDPVAEIGYWAGRQSRGVMTNAVKAVAALAAAAGFQGLYARTKPGNVRSQAVLARAGFIPRPGKADGHESFELSLAADARPVRGLD
jgi:RimJ/RimL family protein N-acetyltransferase